jgi:multimeric flavodoxin WrbA
MNKEIKVLGINASPRPYGNSFKLLRIALKAAERSGGRTELVNLYDYELKPCKGCLSDEEKACRPPCLEEDDAWKVLRQILDSDALIIATPIYWYGPSSHLKNLIDKMTVFENMALVEGRSWVEGKVAGFIAAGGDSGEILTIAYLMVVFNSMGFLIPPWALAYYTGLRSALEKSESVLDAANVGLAVVQAARKIGSMEWYDPKLVEKLGGESLIKSIEEEAKRIKKDTWSEREKLIKKLIGTNYSKYRGRGKGGSG